MERVKGIEPSSQAWEARILPLNHTRAATDTIPTRELSRPQGRNCCPSVLQPKKSNLNRETSEPRESRMKRRRRRISDWKKPKDHKPVGVAHPAHSCGSCGSSASLNLVVYFAAIWPLNRALTILHHENIIKRRHDSPGISENFSAGWRRAGRPRDFARQTVCKGEQRNAAGGLDRLRWARI